MGNTGVQDLPTSAGGGGTTVSATEPGSPSEGDLWYNSSDGSLYVRYSSAWVEAGTTGAQGAQGPQGPTGATGPTGPTGPAGADSASWTQIVNESGASMANWTATNGTGTWSSDGTSINRTDASGAWGINYLKPNVTGTVDQTARHAFLYEAEMQCASGGIVGLTFSRRYGDDSASQVVYFIDVDNDALKFSTFTGINYINDSVAFDAASWFKLRMLVVGSAFDLYYDVGSGWVRQASVFPKDQNGDAYKFGIAAVNQTAKFKNIKAWSLGFTLPS